MKAIHEPGTTTKAQPERGEALPARGAIHAGGAR